MSDDETEANASAGGEAPVDETHADAEDAPDPPRRRRRHRKTRARTAAPIALAPSRERAVRIHVVASATIALVGVALVATVPAEAPTQTPGARQGSSIALLAGTLFCVVGMLALIAAIHRFGRLGLDEVLARQTLDPQPGDEPPAERPSVERRPRKRTRGDRPAD